MAARASAASLAVAAVALLIAGCTVPSTPGPSAATPSTPPVAGTSVCVPDPDAVIARTQDLPATPMPDDVAGTIDRAAEAGFAAAAAPGAIVAVQSSDGLFVEAYGIADPATGEPMTVDMFQRVGSITKPFTGTLVMQLVADGTIGLEDPISTYVDGVTGGDEITIRMLADMSSGVSSYTRDEAWAAEFFARPEKVWPPDELLEIGLSLPPQDFVPGTAFDYSNTNTVLLGKVIEEATGQPFEVVLQERILTPLALTGTSFPAGSAAFPEPHAQGFTLQGGRATPEAPENATDWNPSWGWTAGELISNVPDLLRYARAQATGQGLLPGDAQLVRLTSFREFSGPAGYGIGWGCQDAWVGHAGELPGYNTSMFYDTNSDTTIVTMTNSDIRSGDCEQSLTLADDPGDLSCSSPATRIFVSVSEALGIPFTPPNSQ